MAKFLILLLLLPIGCSPAASAEQVNKELKIYDTVDECPTEWQDCAKAGEHTSVYLEPGKDISIVHWVTTCSGTTLECLVKYE